MESERFVTVGKIIGAHGMHGALKVYSYAESLDLFSTRPTIFLKSLPGENAVYDIEWARPHSKGVLLSLKGIRDRDAAEALKGTLLQIKKADLPELEAGSYYWTDLIGMEVFTRGNAYLGRLESILETGSNDVYVVRGECGEVLVPALASVVLEVDVEQKRMRVELPEGL